MIEVKNFLGFIQTSEMRMYLNRSFTWQEAQLSEYLLLKQAAWQNKLYIGYYLSPFIPCSELKRLENQVKSDIQLYCPKMNLDQHQLFLFPQIFIQ